MMLRMQLRACIVGCAGIIIAAQAQADSSSATTPTPQFSNFGGVGLLETRSARMAPDGTLSATASINPALQRYAVNFQAAPWLEATFSYQTFDVASTQSATFDRQFDLKVRLWEEQLYLPAVAIGLQDFLGTGLFSGEYIVASKRFGALDLSLGAGWGRLGSNAVIKNPVTLLNDSFSNRDEDFGLGGEVNFGQYFRGDQIGVFGGVTYDTPIKGLRLIAEYDSDDKSPINDFDSKTPINVGLSYVPFDGIAVTASLLHGSQFNLNATASADISRPLRNDPKDQNVIPFAVRDGRGLDPSGDEPLVAVSPMSVSPVAGTAKAIAEALEPLLREDGIVLRDVVLGDSSLQIGIENRDIRSIPKAVGRTTRHLTAIAPTFVEEFRVTVYEQSMAVSEFDIDRETIEASARIRGSTANPPVYVDSFHTGGIGILEGDKYLNSSLPDFSWSFGPDVRLSPFDPDDPLRYNIDLVADARVEILDGLFASGSVRADIFGNFDEITRQSDSVLPRVRSEFANYYRETDIGIERLAADYFFKPAENTFAKVSAGLLESSFGGFGGEILYRPPQSRFAWGAELYYAKQRDFDTLFAFRDYDVVTGHVSGYYDTDFHDLDLAIHAGRYLAGDWGATIEATRRFANGWEVGAFATFTNVPFDEFGEGSFDKGLIFRVPLDWGLPYETRSAANLALRPLQRDGGQRLSPGDRLFRITQPASASDVKRQWHEFSH